MYELDIDQIKLKEIFDSCVETFQSSNSIAIIEANKWIEEFSNDLSENWKILINIINETHIIDYNKSSYSKFIAVKLLRSAISNTNNIYSKLHEDDILIIINSSFNILFSTINDNKLTPEKKQTSLFLSSLFLNNIAGLIGNSNDIRNNIEKQIILTLLHYSKQTQDHVIFVLYLLEEIPNEERNLDLKLPYNLLLQHISPIKDYILSSSLSIFTDILLKNSSNENNQSDLVLLNSSIQCILSWCCRKTSGSSVNSQIYIDSTWIGLNDLCNNNSSILNYLIALIPIMYDKRFNINIDSSNYSICGNILKNIFDILNELISCKFSPNNETLCKFTHNTISDALPLTIGIMQSFQMIMNVWDKLLGGLELFQTNMNSFTLSLDSYVKLNYYSTTISNTLSLSSISTTPGHNIVINDDNTSIFVSLVELTVLFMDKHKNLLFENSNLYQEARRLTVINLFSQSNHNISHVSNLISTSFMACLLFPSRVSALGVMEEYSNLSKSLLIKEESNYICNSMIQPTLVVIISQILYPYLIDQEIIVKYELLTKEGKICSSIDGGMEEEIEEIYIFRQESILLIQQIYTDWSNGGLVLSLISDQLVKELENFQNLLILKDNSPEISSDLTINIKLISNYIEGLMFMLDCLIDSLSEITLQDDDDDDDDDNDERINNKEFTIDEQKKLYFWWSIICKITVQIHTLYFSSVEFQFHYVGIMMRFINIWGKISHLVKPVLNANLEGNIQINGVSITNNDIIKNALHIINNSILNTCTRVSSIYALNNLSIYLKSHLSIFSTSISNYIIEILKNDDFTTFLKKESKYSIKMYNILGRFVSFIADSELKRSISDGIYTNLTSNLYVTSSLINSKEISIIDLNINLCNHYLNCFDGFVKGIVDNNNKINISVCGNHSTLCNGLLTIIEVIIDLLNNPSVRNFHFNLLASNLINKFGCSVAKIIDNSCPIDVIYDGLIRMTSILENVSFPLSGLIILITALVRQGSKVNELDIPLMNISLKSVEFSCHILNNHPFYLTDINQSLPVNLSNIDGVVINSSINYISEILRLYRQIVISESKMLIFKDHSLLILYLDLVYYILKNNKSIIVNKNGSNSMYRMLLTSLSSIIQVQNELMNLKYAVLSDNLSSRYKNIINLLISDILFDLDDTFYKTYSEALEKILLFIYNSKLDIEKHNYFSHFFGSICAEIGNTCTSHLASISWSDHINGNCRDDNGNLLTSITLLSFMELFYNTVMTNIHSPILFKKSLQTLIYISKGGDLNNNKIKTINKTMINMKLLNYSNK